MLSWVGKRPLREVRTYPAQLVERFGIEGETSGAVDWSDWQARFDHGGASLNRKQEWREWSGYVAPSAYDNRRTCTTGAA